QQHDRTAVTYPPAPPSTPGRLRAGSRWRQRRLPRILSQACLPIGDAHPLEELRGRFPPWRPRRRDEQAVERRDLHRLTLQASQVAPTRDLLYIGRHEGPARRRRQAGTDLEVVDRLFDG